MILVGLDIGTHNGIAVLDKSNNELKLYCLKYWELSSYIDKLKTFTDQSGIKIIFYVEDVLANKPTFNLEKIYTNTIPNYYNRNPHKAKLSAVAKVSQRVGSVMDKTKLIIEKLQYLKFEIHLQRPTKSTLTKIDAKRFKMIFPQYKGKSNNHERDAACLLVGR